MCETPWEEGNIYTHKLRETGVHALDLTEAFNHKMNVACVPYSL